MASSGDISKYSDIFATRLPGTAGLFLVLALFSIVIGVASVALDHYSLIHSMLFEYVIIRGVLVGMIAILLPAVLTVFMLKATKRMVQMKHLLFISIIGAVSYSIFLLLGSILHIAFGAPAATAVIFVGDASIFGWWFFINKVVLGFRKRAVLFALVQPTLNIILYLVVASSLFTFNRPLSILFLKLYLGIFVFMIVSYMLLYMFDRPLKKNLGVGGIDLFAGLLQNWLFNINTAMPFATKLGIKPDVETNTIVAKSGRDAKVIFFVPELHYGPAGNLGASDFPYILETQMHSKYKSVSFVMHPTVTADRNPMNASQISRVRSAMLDGIENGTLLKGGMTYSEGVNGDSHVIKLSFNGVSLVTFTRAPHVTEDVAYDVSSLFKKTLGSKYGHCILIDAHNSRYESAPKSERNGVRFDSRYMKDYIRAIDSMKQLYRSRTTSIGAKSVEIYRALGRPRDIGRGNLNVAIFSFGSFKYGIVQFNSNNVLPSLRNEIVSYIKKRYKVHAEVYTTDTHSVNSLEWAVENVLGRHTKFNRLKPFIDKAMIAALSDISHAKVYHKKVVMNKFPVWGPEVGDIMVEMTKDVIARARILSPIIIISGFIIAALLISVV